MAFRLMVASSSLWPPDRNVTPGVENAQCHVGTMRARSDRVHMHVHLTCHGRGHGATQGGDGRHGDLLRAVFFGAGVSSSHHVGFEQRTLQIHMVVRQSLVDGCQNLEEPTVKIH